MHILTLCFNYKGRVNRSTFWICNICSNVVLWGYILLLLNSSYSIPYWFGILIVILVLVGGTNLTIAIKRLHDTDRHENEIFWGLVPILGQLYLIIVLGFLQGTQGSNRYGNPTTLRELITTPSKRNLQ